MMTGQILGGSPVTEAAHYQILITYCTATCTLSNIFMNVFVLYRVAFDAGTHVLRTDRFIEVVKNKQKNNHRVGGIIEHMTRGIQNYFSIGSGCVKACLCCFGLWGLH